MILTNQRRNIMGTKILVVDDDRNICELLKLYLKMTATRFSLLMTDRKQLKCFSLKHLNLCFLILCFENGRLAGLP